MVNQELTAKKVLLIVVLTIVACVPSLALYLGIFLFTYPFIGAYAPILSLSIIAVPLLLATAYTLKRRTEREQTEKRSDGK